MTGRVERDAVVGVPMVDTAAPLTVACMLVTEHAILLGHHAGQVTVFVRRPQAQAPPPPPQPDAAESGNRLRSHHYSGVHSGQPVTHLSLPLLSYGKHHAHQPPETAVSAGRDGTLALFIGLKGHAPPRYERVHAAGGTADAEVTCLLHWTRDSPDGHREQASTILAGTATGHLLLLEVRHGKGSAEAAGRPVVVTYTRIVQPHAQAILGVCVSSGMDDVHGVRQCGRVPRQSTGARRLERHDAPSGVVSRCRRDRHRPHPDPRPHPSPYLRACRPTAFGPGPRGGATNHVRRSDSRSLDHTGNVGRAFFFHGNRFNGGC